MRQRSRTPIQKIADAVASYFVPAVLAIVAGAAARNLAVPAAA